jgi:hypothetical protein
VRADRKPAANDANALPGGLLMPDKSDIFNPMAQFAEMQALLTSPFSAWKSVWGALPTRYEPLDPTVQEIAILVAMHNMASMLQNPGAIKEQLNVELSERVKKLAGS